MKLADGTKYAGDFKNGKYEGQGVITRPNGEKYEGSFSNGLPHGLGIYFNGDQVERCEYYQGKRIDQAYLIRQENERNLAALRDEREKAAKEKADRAEQTRIAQERQAAAQKAASERSSNNLLGALIVGGSALLIGGAVGLDTGSTVALAASAAVDAAKGDSSMSTMKQTSQTLLDANKKSSSGSAAQQPSPTKGSISGGSSALSASSFIGNWHRVSTPDINPDPKSGAHHWKKMDVVFRADGRVDQYEYVDASDDPTCNKDACYPYIYN